MLARFDHRPRLTALLALSTTVLVVVVITLATLLVTAEPQAATSLSEIVGHPGGRLAVPGTGENYGEGWNNYGHDVVAPKPAQKGDSQIGEAWHSYLYDAPPPQPAQTGNGADSAVDRHTEVVSAYNR